MILLSTIAEMLAEFDEQCAHKFQNLHLYHIDYQSSHDHILQQSIDYTTCQLLTPTIILPSTIRMILPSHPSSIKPSNALQLQRLFLQLPPSSSAVRYHPTRTTTSHPIVSYDLFVPSNAEAVPW